MAPKKAKVVSAEVQESQGGDRKSKIATTKKELSVAHAALKSNHQFVNPKFWEKVEYELFKKVGKAMIKAEKTIRQTEAKKLKEKMKEVESQKSIFQLKEDAETPGTN